jgi:hypothetical protein
MSDRVGRRRARRSIGQPFRCVLLEALRGGDLADRNPRSQEGRQRGAGDIRRAGDPGLCSTRARDGHRRGVESTRQPDRVRQTVGPTRRVRFTERLCLLGITVVRRRSTLSVALGSASACQCHRASPPVRVRGTPGREGAWDDPTMRTPGSSMPFRPAGVTSAARQSFIVAVSRPPWHCV